MSKLRPTLNRSDGSRPCMTNGTAYMMILSAVQSRPGLVHGELKRHGEYCAIGSYFEINKNTSLPETLVDEVAAVNDSVPNLSELKRKEHVLRWLKWKLQILGMTFRGRKLTG